MVDECLERIDGGEYTCSCMITHVGSLVLMMLLLCFLSSHTLSRKSSFRGTFSHNVLIVLPFARRGFYLYLRRALRMV